MGKAIVVGLTWVVLAIVVSTVVVYFRRRQSKETALEKGWATKGDLNRLQEQKILSENESAEEIFLMLLEPPQNLSFDEQTSLLGAEHRSAIESWLRSKSQYTKTTRKGITR